MTSAALRMGRPFKSEQITNYKNNEISFLYLFSTDNLYDTICSTEITE